ncbi:MAG: TetR/AcrR family transcriptional regulator [Acidobacteriota bacterium]|nr:TetR/AcrR family transcriptional regulator [Acidobacteriota bacterium]
MRTKKQVVAEFRRAAIVDAGSRVFTRHGFVGGSVDMIAREAGLAKGTVYLYFRSKREIYRAVLMQEMQRMKHETIDSIDGKPDLRSKILTYLVTRISHVENNRGIFRITDLEDARATLTRSQYHELVSEPVQKLSGAIAEAAKNGEIRCVDAERAAWGVADLTRGAVQRRMLGHSHLPVEAEAEALLGFIWAALEKRAAR